MFNFCMTDLIRIILMNRKKFFLRWELVHQVNPSPVRMSNPYVELLQGRIQLSWLQAVLSRSHNHLV
uniref:Uncharacterized protein n=1 Tax=Arundo donax TaxID=35708 RepID=A0A0A9GJE8_ARUDO